MSDQKTEQKPEHEKRIREALLIAAVNCPHEITEDQVTFYFNAAKPGNNALDQLMTRLEDAAIRALLADLDAVRGALDHIHRTCKASRSQTRRLRWIEARAYGALIGDHELHRTIDLPKDGGPDTTEKLKRKLAHERYAARVAQGLSVGILTAALKGASA